MGKTEINARVISAIAGILQETGVSKAALARSLGVSPSRFSEILGLRMMAGTELMALLAERYGISSDWLLTGRGEMVADRAGMRPADRVAVVTGGTSGLGLGVVRRLSDIGYNVYSISRNGSRIEALSGTIPNARFCRADVTSRKEMEEVCSVVSQEHGHVDVLVNNAGTITPGGVETLQEDDFEKMLQVNCMGPFLSSKVFLPLMKDSPAPCIVNVSSISSRVPGSSLAYSACKAALDMMTRSMAKELSAYRIRVNGVNPGIVDTGFQVHNGMMNDDEYHSFLEDSSSSYPLGIGGAADVCDLIMFLVSDKARWITGSNYVVDGGRCLL